MKQSFQEKKRFHIFYAVRYLKYGFLLCLIPMIQALLAFDLPSLFTALRQDAFILLLCSVVALWLWWNTNFIYQDRSLFVQQGVIFERKYVFQAACVAAIEIHRPLHCRLFGASKLTLYFKDFFAPQTFLLYLPKKTAAEIAEQLMPVKQNNSVFAPTGFERLAFVMLSANVLTSGVFIWMSAKQLTEIFGEQVQVMAVENFSRIELWLEQFLPAGMAVLTALLFVVISITFLYSLLHTAGFTVCRNGGIIINKGGLITKIERRISVQAVSACNVRITPVARLLRRYPLYLSAGSFKGGDIPLMVYRKNMPQAPEILLQNFTQPDAPLCVPARKSVWQYLWLSLTCLSLSLGLCGVAVAVMPGILPILAVPVLLSGAGMLQAYEGFLKEGICKNKNRTLSITFTRFFTRHEVCVFTPNVAYTTYQHPLSLNAGRADFTVSLPCRLRYKARGIVQYVAHKVPFTL